MTSSPVGPGFDPATSTTLSAVQQRAVHDLALDVELSDGAEPLNEPALLRLGSPAGEVVHLLVSSAGRVVGYAQLEPSDPATAEVVVGPVPDRVRLADDLLAAAEAHVREIRAADSLLVWSRGASPVAAAAPGRGYTADRTLLSMRRSLADVNTDPVAAPAGITLRAFRPGSDDEAWLAVNAAAFATHPEQGSWTSSDLQERIAQPWFDPAGFILAEGADGDLLGYHWTKLHGPSRAGAAPLGEVYVLGIAPGAQGRGLGRVLLDAGLHHLAAGPAREVILYVEADNPTAVRLYERDGFRVDRRDVQFRRRLD